MTKIGRVVSKICSQTDRPQTRLSQQVCADNVALPAFARRCSSNRSISPARRAHSSKPGAAGLLRWVVCPCWDRQMERRTDRQTDGHRTVPLPRVRMRAVPIIRLPTGVELITSTDGNAELCKRHRWFSSSNHSRNATKHHVPA